MSGAEIVDTLWPIQPSACNAFMSGYYCLHLLEIPLEKIITGGTEEGFFIVGVFYLVGRIHHTAAIPAMGQTQRMPQFVECRLLYAVHIQTRVWRLFIKFRTKAMDGYHRTRTFHLCDPKDILEDRDKQIHFRYPHKLQCIFRTTLDQVFQDQF